MRLPVRVGGIMLGVAALAIATACSTQSAPQGEKSLAAAEQSAPKVAAPRKPAGPGYTVAYRRLTESQYRHVVADTFGKDIVINARFEPEQRLDGLQAIGNSRLSVTTTGLEQYIAVARSIADQVFAGDNKDKVLGCTPGEGEAQKACAETFIRTTGEQLFRRPLTDEEVSRRVAMWQEGVTDTKDFYQGAKLSLISLLIAPDFLFRVDRAELDAKDEAQARLDGYTRASRLSFLFWDSGPDAELLDAASSGALHTPEGLQKQVDRLIASPRLEDGVRAFWIDMLRFEGFDNLSKDPTTYPLFSQAMADGAREETLKFLVDQLVTQKNDYREIFTSRETFVNRPLAALYNVPFASSKPWMKVKFPEDSERSGIITQTTFLSLFSHPAASSPTIRGVNLNDIFLCQPTPQPPPDVDFSKVQALENGTVRTRLEAHRSNPGCAVCHNASDPVGLALEHFDGIGQVRKFENGELIDVEADLRGTKISGARGVGQYLHDSPYVPKCLARNVYYYSQGRTVDDREAPYIEALTKRFSEAGYRVPDLYRAIATDPEFFKVVTPAGLATQTASSSTPSSGGDGK